MSLLSLSERYEENPIARIIVNTIPYLGGALDVALSTKWSQYQKQRVDDLINKLNAELSSLDEKKVDKSFLESEEFYDLVYCIAHNALKTRNPEIRTGFARVIKSALKQEKTITDLEDLARQLSEISQKDLVLLRAVKRLYDSGEDVTGQTVSRALHPMVYSELDAERHLYRFENLGLLDHLRNRLTVRGGMKFEKLPLFDTTTSFLGL